MALLKSFMQTPHLGWKYFQRETEFTLTGDNWFELVKAVIDHRVYKNLHPQDQPSVELDIQRQMCRMLGKYECRSEGPQDKWLPLPPDKELVTIDNIMAFSKAAFAFAASGGEMVPIEEAERRAEVCRRCVFNESIKGCACAAFYKLLDKTIKRERRLPGLGACRICHCSLVVKVNLTDEQVRISNEGRDLPWPDESECWQAKIQNKAVSKS